MKRPYSPFACMASVLLTTHLFLAFAFVEAQPSQPPRPPQPPRPFQSMSSERLPESSPTPVPVEVEVEAVDSAQQEYQLEGIASWYGGKFQGRLTANGEVFDTNQLSAAHRELPFGTIVRVTNTDNGRTVVVRINDRGPFVDNRVIDLSRAAADLIGLTSAGIAPVQLDILHYEPESDLRTLQIASFASETNARAVAAALREAGFDPAMETVSDRSIHRVVITDVPEADIPDHRERLSALGYSSVLVRRQ